MRKSKEEDLPGFPTFDACEDVEVDDFDNIFKQKAKKKGGGFQSMGLSFEVLKGITKRGYKVPTPIQRKAIPLILEGRDVVAMAKTGSGKTACFLIPMFEKLKCRDPTKGARALVLSPTRELAVQTYKFIKELGRFLELKTILVLGGDSMNSQFSAMHSCPDIIVATPGRFLHLCVEMDLKLIAIEYIVFDESDRLFEMGFSEQINEILHRLPASRQMVMFSATLPKVLVEFANAGLSDPVLLRLDVESKLPDGLYLKFIYCRPVERYTTLVVLLKYAVPSDAQTVVFAATQHHINIISYILTEAGISNTIIYSSLDPSARKINTAKFANKRVSVLIVTDVAARGIDIPSIDCVISFHFPGKPKLFVHRVGRCARAGRTGTAYSIFSTDDTAHLLDLHLFLNRRFNLSDSNSIGTVPQDFIEEEHSSIMEILKSSHISGTLRSSENAYKRYIVSRPVASVDANTRVKKLKFYALKPLEVFLPDSVMQQKLLVGHAENQKSYQEKHNLLLQIKDFRPLGTIFEMNFNQSSIPYTIMKEKRSKNTEVIKKYRAQLEESEKEENEKHVPTNTLDLKIGDEALSNVFNKIVIPKRRKNMDDLYNKKRPDNKKKSLAKKKDTENFVPYQSTDRYTEDGLAINSFQHQALNAEFSVVDRDAMSLKTHKPGAKKWDRIKKKMVVVSDPRTGKIRTESGAWISSSFKTGRYNTWKVKTKIEEQMQRETADSDEDSNKPLLHKQRYPIGRFARHNANVAAKKLKAKTTADRNGRADQELRNPDQIVKKRMRLEFIKKRNTENTIRKAENRKRSMRKNQIKRIGQKWKK